MADRRKLFQSVSNKRYVVAAKLVPGQQRKRPEERYLFMTLSYASKRVIGGRGRVNLLGKIFKGVARASHIVGPVSSHL